MVTRESHSDLPIDVMAIGAMLKEHCHTYIMPFYKRLSAVQIRTKGARDDVVTDADEAMEHHFGAALSAYLPASLFLGEEVYSRHPGVADFLLGDDYVWVLDPLDGTRNFVRGEAAFCSMLALVKSGEVLAAWIYLPLEDRLLMADKYGGAYDGEGRAIRICDSGHDSLSSAALVGQINFGLFAPSCREERRAAAVSLYKRLDRVFCVGYDFSGMCLLRRHFSAYGHLLWWDHIPGVFIFRQAGGVILCGDGRAYSPCYPARRLIAAVTPAIAAEIAAFINSGAVSDEDSKASYGMRAH